MVILVIEIHPIYECNRYHKQIGTKFYYYTKYHHEMLGTQTISYHINIYDGEIEYASGTMVKTHDIRDNIDESNWESVKEILSIFKNTDFEKFKILYGMLDKNSIGHSIAESIIDENIKELEENVKKLQLLKKDKGES